MIYPISKRNVNRALQLFVLASGLLTVEVSAADEFKLEEVIVTAQRREESLQDVAISITVFNQEQIANADMVNTSDLATYTPSLSSNQRFGPENASFSIRGFNKALRTTASVGVYFAEVVAPRGQYIQTSGDGAGPGMLFDLRNVQVLKGPQGTLFGRNTTGGSILIEPARPGDQFEGYVQFSTGDFDSRGQQLVINAPVSERFKIRVGIDKKEREGHLNNVSGIGADDLGNVDYLAGRLSLLFDVTESFENYTIINYSDSDTHGYTSQLFACNPNPNPDENPLYAFIYQPCQSQLDQQEANGQNGFYDLVSSVPEPLSASTDLRFINKITWDISPNLTAKNILAYSHLETFNESDLFGTRFTESQAALTGLALPAGLADPRRELVPGVSVSPPGLPVTRQETWVAEVQLQGLHLDSRLEWQVGAYYENSQPDGFSGNTSAVLISCDLATLKLSPSEFNCFDPTSGAIGSVVEGLYKTEYLSKAVYAQFNYDLFSALRITLGARHTEDETRGETYFTRHNFVLNQKQPGIVSDETAVQKSSAPTGLFELQYTPLNGLMAYAKYIRGYRQGAVNMAADQGLQSYEPETVDTYEIGLKANWDWLVPGRLSIAAFDNDFRDMQLQGGYISQSKGPTTAIFNAGKAEIRGVEAEATLRLLRDLTLNLSYSRLDTELLEQADNQQKVESTAGPVAGATYSPIANVGDQLPFAPESSLVASLNYDLPAPESIGSIRLGLTYVHTGEQSAAASSVSPFATLSEYSLLNANVNWLSVFGSPLDISIFGTNLRDEEYTTFVHGSYRTLGLESRSMGMPKMVGARLTYNFGDF